MTDSRTWFKHEPVFVSVITIATISPSELDLVELGVRASVAYCQQLADRVNAESWSHARILHPVEQTRLDTHRETP